MKFLIPIQKYLKRICNKMNIAQKAQENNAKVHRNPSPNYYIPKNSKRLIETNCACSKYLQF